LFTTTGVVGHQVLSWFWNEESMRP
jgi:hypothetical protein